jgi:kinesin family protein 2/24
MEDIDVVQVGEVRPRVISTEVHSATELQALIARALDHRHTSATDRNAQSSRSHAVFTIRIKNKLMPYAEEGLMILVEFVRYLYPFPTSLTCTHQSRR